LRLAHRKKILSKLQATKLQTYGKTEKGTKSQARNGGVRNALKVVNSGPAIEVI
jgi:hypothetical protein